MSWILYLILEGREPPLTLRRENQYLYFGHFFPCTPGPFSCSTGLFVYLRSRPGKHITKERGKTKSFMGLSPGFLGNFVNSGVSLPHKEWPETSTIHKFLAPTLVPGQCPCEICSCLLCLFWYPWFACSMVTPWVSFPQSRSCTTGIWACTTGWRPALYLCTPAPALGLRVVVSLVMISLFRRVVGRCCRGALL